MPGQQRFLIQEDDGSGAGPTIGSGVQYNDAAVMTGPDGKPVNMPAGRLAITLTGPPEQWVYLRSTADAEASVVNSPRIFVWLDDTPAPVVMADGSPLLCSRPRSECTDGKHEAVVGDIVVRWTTTPPPAPDVAPELTPAP